MERKLYLYPGEQEPFKLTIDSANPKHAPLSPAAIKQLNFSDYVHYQPENLQYLDQIITVTQTRRFMLVRPAHEDPWENEEILETLYGPAPPGQWILPFYDRYYPPFEHQHQPAVSIDRASWTHRTIRCHPYVTMEGKLTLSPTGGYHINYEYCMVFADQNNQPLRMGSD